VKRAPAVTTFRDAEAPGGESSLRAFVRGYLRARRRLLQRPPMRRLLRRAEQRAGEWRAVH
jgi:histone H3/H4